MRRDMHKVIVERPRRGSRGPYRGVRWEKNVLVEDLPKREGIGRRHLGAGSTRELNENLAPLERYLRKQVGRPWNAVYRDICARLRPTSAVQLHVRQHLRDFVEIHVTVDANRRVFRKPHGFWGGVLELRPGDLYVHPVTGLLTQTKRRRR